MKLLGKQYSRLSFLTIVMALVLASFFLFLIAIQLATIIAAVDAANFISPDFPARAQTENTIASATMLLCTAVLIFTVFRSKLGGVLLFACAGVYSFVFKAFHLSTALYPARGADYKTSWSVVAVLIILIGALSIVRHLRAVRRAPCDPVDEA